MSSLSAHYKYLKYVLRHKRFVYQEGRKLKLPRRQLLVHDFQKFMRAEWSPYVETFYGDKESPRRKDGGYDPNSVSDAFDLAWLHHQKVGGKHHWQYWILPLDDGGFKALPMPDKYRREMVADWRGAGRAQGKGDDVLSWYDANRERMILATETREWVEAELGYDYRDFIIQDMREQE